ncbi:15802_t:CDS:2, partial [Dentiscutata heterogama]
DQRLSNEVTSPEAKHHKAVAVPELELVLKEFILIYQNRTILSDTMIVEKAKLLAEELGVPEDKLHFSAGWLQKFKEQNEIHQIKLHGEASSVDEDIVTDSLPFHKLDGLTLQHVDVHFFSKNTTSKLQPIDAGVIMAFKKAYRQFHLWWILEQVEAGNLVQDLKMNVLQVVLYIIKGWEEVLANTIRNCWNHTQILPPSAGYSDNLHETNDSELRDLISSLDTLCLPNAMEVDKFLNINGKEVVYKVSPEDQAIKELVYVFKNDENIEAINDESIEVIDDGMDDSIESAIISGSLALNSLESVQMFLLQQEGSNEQLKSINFLEKFIRRAMSNSALQTRIDEYFK